MSVVSTVELLGKDVITFIQIYNNNKTRWKFQAYQTERLEHRGIKKLVGKKRKNYSIRWSYWKKRGKYTNQIKKGHTMLMLNEEIT